MPFADLQSFVAFLERNSQLQRIKVEVDPVLEITEIANRTFAAQGPALLFENVKGSKFPLVINTLATAQRIEWALGRSPSEIGTSLSHFADSIMPPALPKLWQQRKTIQRILSMKPRIINNGPVFKNKIEPADLNQLPVAQSWPKDGGKFMTFPLVITKSPVDGRQNMGVYRMHVYDKNLTGMHWQISKGGGYHYQEAEARNEDLNVCVALGADPILMLCGILPLPEGLDEISFAGFLRDSRTPVGQITARKLKVPANAEFILEGFVPLKERRLEGPYGDHFGHYSQAADFPVFHIERIWHRDGAIFPISVVGKPPQEDQVTGDAVQQMLLPLLKVMHPEIVDLWAYMEAGFHNLCVASVKQRFQKEAIKTALWMMGEGQLALTKVAILVDPDVNARRFPDVLQAILKNFDPAHDFILLPGTSQDTLDFTGVKMNLGSKMIIDATNKKTPYQPNNFQIDFDRIKQLDSRILNVASYERCMVVLQVQSNGREILEKVLKSGLASDGKLIVAVSADVPLDNPVLLLWGIFTRFDCERDTFFENVSLRGGHPLYKGALFIDATWKEGYPEALEMTHEIKSKVDRRWSEYGIKI